MTSYTKVKKLINDPDTIVRESLIGLTYKNQNITLLPKSNTIIRTKIDQSKVSIICGGGSGHEPAHAGFVGLGMLTGAICGNVFASPSYQDIINGIYHAKSERGILLIIKNYTGDIQNFRLAQQICEDKFNFNIRSIVVNDDTSLRDYTSREKSRGVAGTVLIYKLLGAAAENNMELDDQVTYGEELIKNIGSTGVCQYPCSKPNFGKMFELENDKLEFGIGIHGEKGYKRDEMKSCKDLVKEMLENVIKHTYKEGTKDVVLMVNNQGSVTDLELGVVTKDSVDYLVNEKKYNLKMLLSGRFLSAQDMTGISLTLLYLNDERYIIDLNAKSDWDSMFRNRVCNYKTLEQIDNNSNLQYINLSKKSISDHIENKTHIIPVECKKALLKLYEEVILQEEYFNNLDAEVGDGDLGSNITLSAKELISINKNRIDEVQYYDEYLFEMGDNAARVCGGSSGPLYSAFQMKWSSVFKEHRDKNEALLKLGDLIYKSFEEGREAIKQLGKAEYGERTMLYVLNKIYEGLCEGMEVKELWKKAKAQAVEGCEEVKKIMPTKGRSQYLGDRVLELADPGCEFVKFWVSFFSDNM